MSPTRRQLLQGIAALALAPSKGLAPVATTVTYVSKSFGMPLVYINMPPGWDSYDELDLQLMWECRSSDGYDL